MIKRIAAIGCSFILLSSLFFFYHYSVIPKKLGKDIALTTVSGCTFTMQKGWVVVRNDDVMMLQEPQGELMVALTENQEPTAQQAVAAAWQKIQPGFARIIQYTIQNLANDGWDEIVKFIYDTQTNEDRLLYALARKHGKTWYIELVDGKRGAAERRLAGISLIETSFKVPGLQEELFVNKKTHAFDVARLNKFKIFIEKSRKKCNIPGVAVAIVQHGKIVLEEGFGVTRFGKKTSVNPKTLFMVGSPTKSLTTFMMAKLVDEGAFTWDTPVIQVMPTFALGDPRVTKQLLMKHLVSASTGMPNQDADFMFNYDRATPLFRLEEMRTMKPTTGFGETFQYSNGLVSAAGYIAAHALYKDLELGAAYDALMQSHVFDSIGMPATTFDFNDVKKRDHASPHSQNLTSDYIPLSIDQERWVESIRPAGGLWSNVHDMAQYLIVELNNGINAQGKRVISEYNLLKRREPQIKISDKSSYGLALMTETDHGVIAIGHNGKTLGFTSSIFFLPDYNVGLVVLTNAAGAQLFTNAVKRKFMELIFDGKPLADQMIALGLEQQKYIVEKNLETIVFQPSLKWLKKFEGFYKHETLGTIVVRETTDGAEFDAGSWKSAIGQKKESDGTLKFILTDVPVAGVEFLPQERNGVMQLVLDMGQHKYIFKRN